MKRIFISLLAILIIFVVSGCGNSSDNSRISDCMTTYETVLDQGTCVNYIALEKDTEAKALKICNKIDSGVRNTCYRNIAIKFENKPLCFENENEIEEVNAD